jgi:hypothetical protein
MGDKKKKREETSEDDSSDETSEEEETSGEEGTSDDETSEEDTSEDEKPQPKKQEPPKKAPASKKQESPRKKPSEDRGQKTKTVSSEGTRVTVKKKNVAFEVIGPRGPFPAGSNVEIRVKIVNDSPKQIKSVQAWMQVFKGKKKGKGPKAKRPKPRRMEGTDQEFFQGARFPLPPNVGYEGAVVFPLPKKLEETSDSLEYELVMNIDVSAAFGWNHIQACLPIPIRD